MLIKRKKKGLSHFVKISCFTTNQSLREERQYSISKSAICLGLQQTIMTHISTLGLMILYFVLYAQFLRRNAQSFILLMFLPTLGFCRVILVLMVLCYSYFLLQFSSYCIIVRKFHMCDLPFCISLHKQKSHLVKYSSL